MLNDLDNLWSELADRAALNSEWITHPPSFGQIRSLESTGAGNQEVVKIFAHLFTKYYYPPTPLPTPYLFFFSKSYVQRDCLINFGDAITLWLINCNHDLRNGKPILHAVINQSCFSVHKWFDRYYKIWRKFILFESLRILFIILRVYHRPISVRPQFEMYRSFSF